MSGLMPVVRPNVFPDIRPRISQIDFPQTEETVDNRQTVWTGSEGQVINLSYNFSLSYSRRSGREEKRQFDIARIKQVEPNGTINEDTYVDVEMAHKFQFKEGEKGPTRLDTYRKPRASDYPNGNVEILEENLVRKNPRE